MEGVRVLRDPYICWGTRGKSVLDSPNTFSAKQGEEDLSVSLWACWENVLSTCKKKLLALFFWRHHENQSSLLFPHPHTQALRLGQLTLHLPFPFISLLHVPYHNDGFSPCLE